MDFIVHAYPQLVTKSRISVPQFEFVSEYREMHCAMFQITNGQRGKSYQKSMKGSIYLREPVEILLPGK